MATTLTKTPTPPRSSPQKWGPSEWFGIDVFNATDATRLAIAQDAKKKFRVANRVCPHKTALTGLPKICNKEGGICSVQRYSRATPASPITPVGIKVAICPHRLVTKQVLNGIVPKVIGAGVQAVLVKEVPYSLSLISTLKSGQPSAAGRIDWLLVDKLNPKNFFALETQAVYMSGGSQQLTFDSFVASSGAMVLSPNHRQPDYKSSVPKRLAPQLESKARHLIATGRKTVVIVDEFVYQNMHSLQEVPVPPSYASDPVRSEQHKLNASEVIFAIVSIANGQLAVTKFLYCTITAAIDSLNAVTAMSKAAFEQVVQDTVAPSGGKPDPAKVIAI